MKHKNLIKEGCQCPEFPHFGARYPDARCIDGELWDLDSCEGDMLTSGGEVPCPFCNTNEYAKHIHDDLNGITNRFIRKHLGFLKEAYLHPSEILTITIPKHK